MNDTQLSRLIGELNRPGQSRISVRIKNPRHASELVMDDGDLTLLIAKGEMVMALDTETQGQNPSEIVKPLMPRRAAKPRLAPLAPYVAAFRRVMPFTAGRTMDDRPMLQYIGSYKGHAIASDGRVMATVPHPGPDLCVNAKGGFCVHKRHMVLLKRLIRIDPAATVEVGWRKVIDGGDGHDPMNQSTPSLIIHAIPPGGKVTLVLPIAVHGAQQQQLTLPAVRWGLGFQNFACYGKPYDLSLVPWPEIISERKALPSNEKPYLFLHSPPKPGPLKLCRMYPDGHPDSAGKDPRWEALRDLPPWPGHEHASYSIGYAWRLFSGGFRWAWPQPRPRPDAEKTGWFPLVVTESEVAPPAGPGILIGRPSAYLMGVNILDSREYKAKPRVAAADLALA